MDPQWIGTISTLAGVVVAGGVAAVRDARAERRQVARDDSQRRHEIDGVWLFWSDVGERVLMRPVPRTGRAAWH